MQTVIYGSDTTSHAQNNSGHWNPAVHWGHTKALAKGRRHKLEAETDTLSLTFIFSFYQKRKAWLKILFFFFLHKNS